jgi:hypothetical protein
MPEVSGNRRGPGREFDERVAGPYVGGQLSWYTVNVPDATVTSVFPGGCASLSTSSGRT